MTEDTVTVYQTRPIPSAAFWSRNLKHYHSSFTAPAKTEDPQQVRELFKRIMPSAWLERSSSSSDKYVRSSQGIYNYGRPGKHAEGAFTYRPKPLRLTYDKMCDERQYPDSYGWHDDGYISPFFVNVRRTYNPYHHRYLQFYEKFTSCLNSDAKMYKGAPHIVPLCHKHNHHTKNKEFDINTELMVKL